MSLLLLGYVVFLALELPRLLAEAETTSPWEIHRPTGLCGWIAAPMISALLLLVCFSVLGFLTPFATRHPGICLSQPSITLGTLALGLTSTYALLQWTGENPPAMMDFLLAGGGCLFGTWVGLQWIRGPRAFFCLMLQLIITGLVLTATAAWLWSASVRNGPLTFPMSPVAPTEKHRLIELIRTSTISQNQEPCRLRLSEQDVNLLLAWACSLSRRQPKATADLSLQTMSLKASLPLSLPGDDLPYFNFQAKTHLKILDGQKTLTVEQMKLGSLEVPQILLGPLINLLLWKLSHYEEISQLIDAIDYFRTEEDFLEIKSNVHAMRRCLFAIAIRKTTITPEITATTKIYLNHLIHHAEEKRFPRNKQFVAAFQAAFSLAKQRSHHRDPIHENYAAIFSLAILMGGPKLQAYTGPILGPDWDRPGRHRFSWMTLRGRRDWSKHFVISAALALAVDDSLSDAIGVFKEKLDIGRHSGFSFADLLAHKAGKRLALAATRDEKAARITQERLSEKPHINDLFPPAADLPEGISDAQLNSEYGGVGGLGYHKIVREIERRLQNCTVLQ